MDVPRNIQFTKLIKISGRQSEFNFRKRGPEQYDVDTSDDRGNRIMFKLVKKEDGWRLDAEHTVPWLTQHENEIGAAVTEYELE
jgi:hypothetical protein